ARGKSPRLLRTGEPDPQRAGGIGQADADVAVVEPQRVVVASDHDRPAGIPVAASDRAGTPQAALNQRIDRADAGRALAVGTEDAEAVQPRQRFGRRGLPVAVEPGPDLAL